MDSSLVLLFSSVQSLSHVRLFVTPWTSSRQASRSITDSRSLPKLMSIESMMPSNHLILCHPLLLLPSIFPNIRVFSNESALCIRWPQYWSFSFNISPSSEHPGLISSVNGTYFPALTKRKIINKLGVQFFGINRYDTCMKLLLSCILILHCNIVHSQARGRIFSQVKYF